LTDDIAATASVERLARSAPVSARPTNPMIKIVGKNDDLNLDKAAAR
jgi:hypothetical protein